MMKKGYILTICFLTISLFAFSNNDTPSSSQLATSNNPTVLIPYGSVWKYLDNGSNQGTAWRAPNFNDNPWSSGNGELGYGDGDESTVVSYGNSSSNKHITTYFRKTITIPDVTAHSAMLIRLIYDDAAAIYVNGQEVARYNLPSSFTYTTTSTATVGNNANAEIEIDRNYFQDGSNTIAVEIHQTSRTSSDISFDLHLEDVPGIDTDGDGIEDNIECNATPCEDTDNDNIPDYQDPDDDGDGIATIDENLPNPNKDFDNDNIPNYLDTDSDNDGIDDSVECPGGAPCANTDGTANPDYLDLDSDNDNVPDSLECTSIPCLDTDLDNIPNFQDRDDDNDGILTIEEDRPFTDGNPINDDVDTDNIPNYLDTDSDGDMIADADECPTGAPCPNNDNDTNPDYLDLDSDGDNILDSLECPTLPCLDTDLDGIPNFQDPDDDNDGILTIEEDRPLTDGNPLNDDFDMDNIPNYLDTDSDGDTLADADECPTGAPCADSDSVGDPDFLDIDSDDDMVLDSIDVCPTLPELNSPDGCPDTDGDGVPDNIDICINTPGPVCADGCPDSDGDCVGDVVDGCPTVVGPICAGGCPDSDGDCVADNVDDCPNTPGGILANGCPDSDGDGIRDIDDLCINDPGPACTDGCPDADGDCIEDTSDLCVNDPGPVCTGGCPDADADCIKDSADDCPTLAGVASANGCPDADGDSIKDSDDDCPTLAGVASANGCPDADGDGIKDSDDDCPNDVGVACTNGCPDPDNDCIGTPNDACPDVFGTPAGGGCPRVYRGPYLQKLTPTSVIVRWRTDISNQSAVHYGTSIGNLTGVKSNTGNTTEHSVEITGLQPNTVYYYAIGTPSGHIIGDDADHYFKTSPNVGDEDNYRFWVLGDCGTANNNQRAVRNAYYNFNGNTHTDGILMLGDNAYNDGTDAEYQNAIFQNMYEDKLRNTVMWSTRGNHERNANVYYDIYDFPKNGEAGGMASGSEAYYSFDYANIHFISLDSYISNRSSNGAMLTWLENDLASTTQKWIIAIWHHPPYSKGSHDSDTEARMIEMRQNAVPILEDYGVDLILSGHSHSYERSYLMKGQYGNSNTFDPDQHAMDTGWGREDVDSVYTKTITGVFAGEGAVYAVAGSSGKISNAPLNHPIMKTDFVQLGSLVLDVSGDRMDVKFINNSGAVPDYFTIVKDTTPYGANNDADGDSVLDTTECPNGFPCRDSDNDGIADIYDKDDDNDGIPTIDENIAGSENVDGDALPNYLDTDSDNDGYNDSFECGTLPCANTDNTGLPNFLDTDSDDDTVLDGPDQCYLVAGVASANGCPDADGDGIRDSQDSCPTVVGPSCTSGCPDNDSDCIANASDNCPDVTGTIANGGCPRVVRGPYLQKLTPTSVVVKWRTDVAVSSGVFYREVGVATNTIESDAAVTTDHEIEITGLTPATKHYYRLGDTNIAYTDNEISTYFTTSPTVGQDGTYSFWVLGDCGTRNNNARAVRDAFYARHGNTHLDGILMLGDNAYGSGTDSEYQNAVFENMYEDRLKNSVTWSARGNHEYYANVYYDIFTFPTNAEAGGLASGTEAYYSFDYGNIHFVVLDSYASSRNTSGAMLTWLDNDLAQNTQKWTIAFWHHPPYTKGSHDSDLETQLIEMRQNALPILEDAGVDLVLSGHSHSYERSKFVNGHYGHSSTFDPNTMIVQEGSGQPTYCKQEDGVFEGDGAVYITAGSSGKISGGALNHPVMHASINSLGSLRLVVQDSVLLTQFVTPTGTLDYFRITKKTDLLTDADSDGILDSDECPGGRPCSDFDNDGIPDFKDEDSDNDGIADIDECPGGAPCTNTDGIQGEDYLDTDSDDDGISDADECPTGAPCANTDGTGLPDYQDTDSDDDTVLDSADNCPLEAGLPAYFGCPCFGLDLKVLLQGPYDKITGQMSTDLSSARKLLPGQTPVGNVAPTPAGHPYGIVPWNYFGLEGANYTDADYSTDVVDWVLVSLRTGTDKASEIAQTAALLMKNGKIETVINCPVSAQYTGPFYIAIEHRNHMGVMSPVPVSVVNARLSYNFTLQDSFKDPTSVGQKQLSNGQWVMYGGDMSQMDSPSYDINGTDKAIWDRDNGEFDQYVPADINLDGDINGLDKIPWEENNGNSSRVPKN